MDGLLGEKHERLENSLECLDRWITAMEHGKMKQAGLTRQRMQKLENDLGGESKKHDREAMATMNATKVLVTLIAAVDLRDAPQPPAAPGPFEAEEGRTQNTTVIEGWPVAWSKEQNNSCLGGSSTSDPSLRTEAAL